MLSLIHDAAPSVRSRCSMSRAVRNKPSKSNPNTNSLSKFAHSENRAGSQKSSRAAPDWRLQIRSCSSTAKNRIDRADGIGCRPEIKYCASAESRIAIQELARPARARRNVTTANATLSNISRMGNARKPQTRYATPRSKSNAQLESVHGRLGYCENRPVRGME